MNFHSTYLGFRADALHPRLYAAARIRGLRRRQNVSNDKVGNLPHTFSLFQGVVSNDMNDSSENLGAHAARVRGPTWKPSDRSSARGPRAHPGVFIVSGRRNAT